MKFNLKNVPLVYCEYLDETTDRCSKDDMKKLSEWFEGFEAELRKMKIKARAEAQKGRSWAYREVYLIEEILGE